MNAEELLKAGIESAKAGDTVKAASLLAESIKLNPKSEEAWLWLGQCLSNPMEQDYCYKRVLAINPGNIKAKEKLEKLTVSDPTFIDPLAEVPSQEKTPTPVSTSIANPASPKNKNTHNKNLLKLVATFTGFTFGLIVFGGFLMAVFMNGAFAKQTMPFAAVMWTPTLSPTYTRTPTKRIIPTSTQTPTVLPSPTTTLTYTQRMKKADPYYTEGFKQYYAGHWAESILAWDKAIEIVPDDDVPYRMRGDAYIKLLENQRTLEEYITNINHAISDYDNAIAINPQNGDYYLARYYAYDDLASVQETRVDSQEYDKIALQNLDLAYRYGNTEELSKRYILFTLIYLGECDKAVDEINKQFTEQTQPSATLNTAMAMAQFCKGNPRSALNSIDEAIKITDDIHRSYYRALILYAMGNYQEAEKEINRSIDNSPNYAGYRYYLRALIYIARGKIDEAQQDLDFGSGNTWEQGGLLPYALGKIALAEKDKEGAIQYFQEAEATYFFPDMILDMIRADLAKLDAAPEELSPQPVEATTIPSLTASLTPRPTSTPQFTATPNKFNQTYTPDPNLNYANVVDLETGTGPMTLGRNQELMLRFQPAHPIDYILAQSLSVFLQPKDKNQENTIQILLYDFETGSWTVVNDTKWGETDLDFAWKYVSPDGDVYARIGNTSQDQIVELKNFGVQMAVMKSDGNVELHGVTP